MNYVGKLYGRLGVDKYFDTGKTSDDWDAMEARIKELEAKIMPDKSIADLNHTVINACMNIYSLISDRVVISEVDKIVAHVKKFKLQSA